MIALFPVSDSMCHVNPLLEVDVSNIERELVRVPVRIQVHFLHPKPVLCYYLTPVFVV
jgi:hypothetical protein